MPVPYYRIELNAIPASFKDLPKEPFIAIAPDSPIKLRREVERFATYFRREFNFDFVQFSAIEKPKSGEMPYAAYLLTSERNVYPRMSSVSAGNGAIGILQGEENCAFGFCTIRSRDEAGTARRPSHFCNRRTSRKDAGTGAPGLGRPARY